MAKVITRFPPSPTGFLHIGGARTALFNYLFAAHEGGEMVLRFEDTDKARSKQEFEEDILNGVQWLGIPYRMDAQPRQSQRTNIYREHLTRLIAAGKAFEAEEAKDEPGKKVIRFKNPNSTVTFADAVRGDVTFDTTELGDFVVAKNADEPLYHLAVVIDDAEAGVTHVIRGEDHISNTARQILILEALGFTRPHYAHIPLILAPDKSKLSKRHGAVSVNEYRAQGFIPEAMVNYLALLGWNPGGKQEIFTLKELCALFSLERVHKGGAVFDMEKLRWFNHEHLKRISNEDYAARLNAYSGKHIDMRLVPLLKERAATLVEAAQALETEFDFIGGASPTIQLLLQNGKIDAAAAKKHLNASFEKISSLSDEAFTPEGIKAALWDYATQEGRGAVLWPLRTSLSGRERSPDPFALAHILGKAEALKRIEAALKLL